MRFLSRNISFVYCLLTLFVGFGGLANAQSERPRARTILERMIVTYASMSSYEDSGVVRLVAPNPLGNRVEYSSQNVVLESETLISFRTYFSRPNRFRFEWLNISPPSSRESVVWVDGKRAYSWLPSAAEDGTFIFSRKPYLALHLDRALSSSLGAVFFVPTLLKKEMAVLPFGARLRRAEELSVAQEEEVDREVCYVIRAQLSGVPWTLWVGKQTYFLRKIRTRYTAKSFDDPSKKPISALAEEIHSNIRINRKIPKNLFKYKPAFTPQDQKVTEWKPYFHYGAFTRLQRQAASLP